MQANTLGELYAYLRPAELEFLQKIAQELLPGAVFVNIGAGVGTSSLAVAEVRQDVTIYTVDISAGGPLGGLENERNAFQGRDLKEPRQILSDSVEAGKTWKHGPIDLLMIDADHSFEACLGDWNAWKKHLKPGGIVLFHDYGDPLHAGVKQAVDGLKNLTKIGQADTLIAFRSAK